MVLYMQNYADTVATEYISQAPWYLDTGAPSLDHQRRKEQVEKEDINQWYARGQRAGPAATKYRKGACENCGAMTHKRADCLERPRKKGAKWTGKAIAADEIIQDFEGGYDAKRDRWNGYDPSEHRKVLEEYAELEKERARLREEEIDNQTSTDLSVVKKLAKVKGGGGEDGEKDPDFGSSDEDDADDDKYADAADAVGQKLDTKTRITVRNLRIREDTAKYLINLDPESAYYDPKTRSMRDAPDKSVRPEDVRTYFYGNRVLQRANIISFRPSLRVTTSFVTQEMLLRLQNSRSLHGKRRKEVMTLTYMPTQPPEKFIIKSMLKQRTRTERPLKYPYWIGTEEKNIYKRLLRNFYLDKQKVTLSIRKRVRSSKVKREPRPEVNTRKMVARLHLSVFFHIDPLHSVYQQSHSNLGLLV